MPVYLDCNATSPTEPLVLDEVIRFMSEEYGNAGSRTHDFGNRAKKAVKKARNQIAEIIKAKPDEVIFTSGATESNNLAILGLAQYGERNNKKHIISSLIEHKAVLEPLEIMAKRGFDITFISPNSEGWIEPEELTAALREDTLLVSMMHVNNETGVVQPISEFIQQLEGHSAYFHVDAAQGFGKDIDTLQSPRIDMISISGHKIYAPKGIGALITRRRGFNSLPLQPLMFGGEQERGLRPGTLPVPLVVGLGVASELAMGNCYERTAQCKKFKQKAIDTLAQFSPIIHGTPDRTIPHTISLAFPGLDSEAVMVALKDEIAISNGSACTSHSYEPSHVLKAMKIDDAIIQGTLRLSWCHMTEEPDWNSIVIKIKQLY